MQFDDSVVEEFPKYTVSRDGVVMRSGRVVVTFKDKKGYLRVNMIDGKRRKQLGVHRLVANAFIGDSRGKIVRHLDGNASNCSASNLAFGTAVENENDKRGHGTLLIGEKHHQSKLTEAQVKNIVIMRKAGARPYDLARWFGVSYYTVYSIASGLTWSHLWAK